MYVCWRSICNHNIMVIIILPKATAIIWKANANKGAVAIGIPQTIIWTNAGILLIWPLGTNFSKILMEIQTIPLKKNMLENVVCEMLSISSLPQCVARWHTKYRDISLMRIWHWSSTSGYNLVRICCLRKKKLNLTWQNQIDLTYWIWLFDLA